MAGTNDDRWGLGEEDLSRLLRESKRYKGESLWNDAWRRLRRNRAAFWSLAFLAAFGLLSMFAPLLPLPSPARMDHSAGRALPPALPWASTMLTSDWGAESTGEEESARKPEDIAPGVLPSRAWGNIWNDGWRHQAVIHVRGPAAEGAPEELESLVREVTGRALRTESRPGDEGTSHYLCVPLDPDDAPRDDEHPTGRSAGLFVWAFDNGGARELVYDLNLTEDLDYGSLDQWSVDQTTRRGKLYIRPEVLTPGVSGYSYSFTLDEVPEGEPRWFILNGKLHDQRGESTQLPAAAKKDLCATRALEFRQVPHSDLSQRMAAALRGAEEAEGLELVEVLIEDGYWELGSFDRWLLDVRSRIFGLNQTGNWCGTDDSGRDLLARIVWGSRTSILVALAATACSLIIGVIYGALSGLLGGRADNLMMRLVDILYSVPFIFVVIFLITIVNEYRTELEDSYGIDREVIFYIVIGAIYWLTMARVVRGQVLSLKNSEFIEAARVMGASTTRILFAHIVPNVLSIVVVYLTLTIPAVMLFEAFLSFLGLGIEPPKVSWGLLAVDGTSTINPLRIYWWLVVFPALAMGSTLLSLNVLGDGLRDALDPKLRGKD